MWSDIPWGTILIGIGSAVAVIFWSCCFLGGKEDERMGWK